jgi:hypothetical protein
MYRCSFCQKSQDEVRKLVAGPTVYICNECIHLCNDIVAEELAEEAGDEESDPARAAASAAPQALATVVPPQLTAVNPADCQEHCWHAHVVGHPPAHGPHAHLGWVAISEPRRPWEAVCCRCGVTKPYDPLR